VIAAVDHLGLIRLDALLFGVSPLPLFATIDKPARHE